MHLVSITPSTRLEKKYMAIFDKDGRKKTTHFGSKGMDDYLQKHDKDQRDRYRTRHKKDLMTRDPTRAGFLSYYILSSKCYRLQKTIWIVI
jgi:Family of unknown function (DUF5754)